MSVRLQVIDLRFLDWQPVNLDVHRDESVGVSGASGSGKSLLLRAIADLDPHEGEEDMLEPEEPEDLEPSVDFSSMSEDSKPTSTGEVVSLDHFRKS